MKILLLMAATFAQTPQPTNFVPAAVIVREISTNLISVGFIQLGGTNFDVLQPRITTNIIARATYNGKVSEIILESNSSPWSTNLCDFKLVPFVNVQPPSVPNFKQKE